MRLSSIEINGMNNNFLSNQNYSLEDLRISYVFSGGSRISQLGGSYTQMGIPIIWQNLDEKCMIMKKVDWGRGGGGRLVPTRVLIRKLYVST